MQEPDTVGQQITSSQLTTLAGIVGIELSEERATALVPQAEQHFALLHNLDALDARGVEPAGVFCLEAWRRGGDV